MGQLRIMVVILGKYLQEHNVQLAQLLITVAQAHILVVVNVSIQLPQLVFVVLDIHHLVPIVKKLLVDLQHVV